MKLTKTILVAALVAGGLFAGNTALFAQAGGGGGGGGGRGGAGGGGRGGFGGVLTMQQNQQIRTAMQDAEGLTDLTNKLAAAQKEALDAALSPDATEATVRPKIEAVAAIQTDIAMLRYNVAVKPIVSSVTDEQKTQIDAAPGMTYNQLFGGGAGFGGGRGGFGGGGRRGGGGGGGGGGRGAAPAN
jgi:Spy/CpxP family protein refolding chaperone